MHEFSEENPGAVKNADMVVGVLSPHDVSHIALAVEKADRGLVEFFPDRKSVIIGCHNAADPGTQEAFIDVKTEVPKISLSSTKAADGRGDHLRHLVRKASQLGARAIIVVDAARSTAITPQQIRDLGNPLLRGFGFVAPLYLHHRFQGTITSNLAYPLTRTLYGRRVRQPLGGDFGFSGTLARRYLEESPWDDGIAQAGMEIWMTALAISHGFPICQSFMGGPQAQNSQDPTAVDRAIFNDVVGTIFTMMNRHEARWRAVKWSKPTAIFGFGVGETETIPEVIIDRGRLYIQFREGVETMADPWRTILTREVFSKLSEVANIKPDCFDLPTALWARILFDYAVAFRRERENRDLLLESLKPLYDGRIFGYVNKVETMSTQQADEYIEEQCLIFEETKPYLIRRWADG
jgi:hypothetical protein